MEVYDVVDWMDGLMEGKIKKRGIWCVWMDELMDGQNGSDVDYWMYRYIRWMDRIELDGEIRLVTNRLGCPADIGGFLADVRQSRITGQALPVPCPQSWVKHSTQLVLSHHEWRHVWPQKETWKEGNLNYSVHNHLVQPAVTTLITVRDWKRIHSKVHCFSALMHKMSQSDIYRKLYTDIFTRKTSTKFYRSSRITFKEPVRSTTRVFTLSSGDRENESWAICGHDVKTVPALSVGGMASLPPLSIRVTVTNSGYLICDLIYVE